METMVIQLYNIDFESKLDDVANKHYCELINKKNENEFLLLEFLFRPVRLSYIDIEIAPGSNGELFIYTHIHCFRDDEDLEPAVNALSKAVLDLIRNGGSIVCNDIYLSNNLSSIKEMIE